jgi:hypothetical protein
MAEEEKSPFEDKGRPSRLFTLLALVGLGLVVLLTDWVMKLILPAR